MRKFVLGIIFMIILSSVFPTVLAAEEEDSQSQHDEGNQYNELGIKKGTKVYGEDISELSEEELQYIPKGWRDGEFESEHPEAEHAEEEMDNALKSSYPDVNEYIKNMNPVTIEYDHKDVFHRFVYRNGYGAVEGVVAHETANNNSTIDSEISYMLRNHENAFVHAFVDDERIIQIHPLDYGAWGAGRYANQRFVHVELVRVHSFDEFARSINNYAHYIASVLHQYNLGVSSAELSGKGTLWSHYAVSKHLGGTTHVDPHGYFEKWGYSWYDFTKLVLQKYKEFSISRISGEDRYKTAVKVSQTGWNSSNTVVLARGDEYADALAGVPLAKKYNAPLLLTQSNKYTEVTKDEIERLGAKTVYLLGGEKAISKSVESKLKSQGLTVKRIDGSTRIDTAAAIANEIGGKEAVLVNGYNFPDALSVASYAAQEGMPILLTQPNKLPAATKQVIQDLNINSTLVVGGTVAVSQNVFNQVPNADRVSGDTRYATAVAVAKHFNVDADQYYVTTGINFPDALSSAALAAKEKTGVLLVNKGLPWQVREFIKSENLEDIAIVGGTSSVASGVQRAIENLLK